jgi:hypothetical protein
MIVFEVAFLLLNLAVPYWVWTSKSASHQPAVEQSALRKTLWDLSNSQNGFAPCSNDDVAYAIADLCEKSRHAWTEKQSTAFGREGQDVLFACEVRKDEIRVQWSPNNRGKGDLDCVSRDPEIIAYAPLFVMNLKGQLRRIEYSTADGGHDSAPMRNCRAKLRKARTLTRMPASDNEFFEALGRLPKDPEDYITENMICLELDPHSSWNKFRDKYRP